MINLEDIKVLVTILIAVFGWIIAHYFSSKRDRRLKRREIITTHLINAYRILANDVTRRDATPDRDLKIKTVIAELQLLGSEKQIELTKKLTYDIMKGGDFYVDDLLNDLRIDLRKELDLSDVDGNVRWLRFGENNS